MWCVCERERSRSLGGSEYYGFNKHGFRYGYDFEFLRYLKMGLMPAIFGVEDFGCLNIQVPICSPRYIGANRGAISYDVSCEGQRAIGLFVCINGGIEEEYDVT